MSFFRSKVTRAGIANAKTFDAVFEELDWGTKSGGLSIGQAVTHLLDHHATINTTFSCGPGLPALRLSTVFLRWAQIDPLASFNILPHTDEPRICPIYIKKNRNMARISKKTLMLGNSVKNSEYVHAHMLKVDVTHKGNRVFGGYYLWTNFGEHSTTTFLHNISSLSWDENSSTLFANIRGQGRIALRTVDPKFFENVDYALKDLQERHLAIVFSGTAKAPGYGQGWENRQQWLEASGQPFVWKDVEHGKAILSPIGRAFTATLPTELEFDCHLNALRFNTLSGNVIVGGAQALKEGLAIAANRHQQREELNLRIFMNHRGDELIRQVMS